MSRMRVYLVAPSELENERVPSVLTVPLVVCWAGVKTPPVEQVLVELDMDPGTLTP
jgi:hypothetical protein